MARTVATLPEGSRITDYISLGVIAKTFPVSKIHEVLAATGKTSVRERDLPAHVDVYYVIALALYMHSSYREVLRCLLEGVHWLLAPSETVKVAGKSGISQARTRLGWEAVRRLHDEVVKPIATRSSRGAWYRKYRLVSLDGSTLDVADEAENEKAFGRPGSSRGSSAYPQIRFVSLVENGTHVLFGSEMADYGTGEITLAKAVLPSLQRGMLCLADRQFFGFELWNLARTTGADLLWRIKKNMRLAREATLSDGSYLSHIYPSERDWRRKTNGGQGPRHRLSPGWRSRCRADLPARHYNPRPRQSSRRRVGCSLSRTMGNRDCSGRIENPSAWRQNRLTKQDPGFGSTGVSDS